MTTQRAPQKTAYGPVDTVSDKGNIRVGGIWYNFAKSWEGEKPGQGDNIRITYHDWTAQPGREPFHMVDDYTVDMSAPAPAATNGSQPDGWLRDDKPIVTKLACQRDAISLVAAWLAQKNPDMETFSLDYLEERVLGLALRLETMATWGGHGALPDTTSELDG